MNLWWRQNKKSNFLLIYYAIYYSLNGEYSFKVTRFLRKLFLFQ